MFEQGDPQKREEIEAYKRGIIERNKVRAAAPSEVPIPNFAEANAMYDADRDGPATLAQMAEAQKRMRDGDSPSEGATIFKEETVAGLKALKEASDKANEKLPQVPSKPTGGADSEDEIIGEFPALGALREDFDPIKNVAEQKAIRERVAPIDITEGIVNGEFRQLVPIVPGKFEVVFRTPSPIELQQVRVLIAAKIDEDPRIEFVLGEMLSLMTLVTQVVSINGNEEAPHMIGDSQYTAEFNVEVFERKLNRYLRYPAPMIYSIGSHCDWFQVRVKECFTSESLKNG